MADQNTGLPVRTEADGTDERLHAKIVDGLTPAQRMEVDTDRNAHVEIHGNDPAAVDRVVRTSELGALTPDGVYHAANNTKPGNSGMIAHTRSATPGDTTQNKRVTSVTGAGNREALDVALSDETGTPYSTTNPLPVTLTDSEGTEVNDHAQSAATVVAASVNHEYTAIGVFVLTAWRGCASGKMKAELSVETGLATGIFANKFVEFNSTANPNVGHELREPIRVAAGVKVRLKKTNLDNQAQDLYSTIVGHEE